MENLVVAASDHGPIRLRWRQDTCTNRRVRKKLFRYEVMWETNQDFTLSMAHLWQKEGKAMTLHDLHGKLAMVAKGLSG